MSKQESVPITKISRVDIGFPSSLDEWAHAKIQVGDHYFSILGHPVMEDWETEYMRELANVATRSGGDILELGFGMGISSEFIQDQDILTHTVIEANIQVFKRLCTFAGSARNLVIPRLGFWEQVCPSLPSEGYLGILFDTYPITEEDVHCNHFPFFEEAYRLLKPGGVLTYYSDEAEDFSEKHLSKLLHAGFSNINKSLCKVSPPINCKYWHEKTLMVPIVVK